VYVGETLGFGVTGTITAGTWVTVSCSRASLFVSQPGVGMAAGTFAWSPQEADVGDHAVVFTAAAQGKVAQEMINIRVLPEPGAWLIVLALSLLRMRMQMAVQARH
jgi:hypothetical protein